MTTKQKYFFWGGISVAVVLASLLFIFDHSKLKDERAVRNHFLSLVRTFEAGVDIYRSANGQYPKSFDRMPHLTGGLITPILSSDVGRGACDMIYEMRPKLTGLADEPYSNIRLWFDSKNRESSDFQQFPHYWIAFNVNGENYIYVDNTAEFGSNFILPVVFLEHLRVVQSKALKAGVPFDNTQVTYLEAIIK